MATTRVGRLPVIGLVGFALIILIAACGGSGGTGGAGGVSASGAGGSANATPDGTPCSYTVPSACDCTYDFCDPDVCDTCCDDTTGSGVYCGGVCQSSCGSSSSSSSGSTGTQSSSSSGSTGTQSSSSGGGCTGFGDPCSDCAAAQCHATFCACMAASDCASLVSCVEACNPSDMACLQTCRTSHESGISEASLLGDCVASSCPACAGAAALSGCEKCLFTSCSSQMNTCLANPECAILVQCFTACNGDGACQNSCAAAHPNGVSEGLQVQSCGSQSCAGSCS